MKKIVIIGAGSMGSAFAVPCIENKNDVTEYIINTSSTMIGHLIIRFITA